MMYIMMWLGCVPSTKQGCFDRDCEVAEGEGYFTPSELPN